MPGGFAGKTVLVTGGGSGIGAASCRAFAASGALVAVIDRDADSAGRVAAELGRNSGAGAHHLDVTDGPGFARLVEKIDATSGGIDVLVNCAGTITQKTIATMSAADWDRVMAVNLGGVFNGIQAVLPHMRARGGGAIVNIASIAGRRISFGGGANYSASKAGVLGLTRHAAYELAPDRIRVNAVCPGPTATPFGGLTPNAEQKAARAKKIPLGRMVEPEDIADAVLFLASDAARMVTGVALDVDGGVLISNDVPYEDYFGRMK
jgi:NAD(P)-dependent dehydrogenase (short-subunit alcohol dehydrogenase family)